MDLWNLIISIPQLLLEASTNIMVVLSDTITIGGVKISVLQILTSTLLVGLIILKITKLLIK